ALKPDKVIGVYISEGMLEEGRKKIKKRGLDHSISLQLGDSEKLMFPENNFDAVIVSFGVRNFANLEKGLADMYRVLKPGGKTVIIAVSEPEHVPLKQGYNFYFNYILAKIGELVCRDNAGYRYLPESVQAFPYGNEFLEILEKTGFKNTKCKSLTF